MNEPRPYMRRRQAFALEAQINAALRDPVVQAVAQIDPAPPDPIDANELLRMKPCPKCGKPLKAKGRHFHIRKCNGNVG